MGYYWPSHFTSLSLGCLWWMPRSEVRNKWDKYVKSLVQCLANRKHSKFDSYVKSPLPASSLVILCPRWAGRGDPSANSKNHPIKVCGIGLLENHIRAKKTRWQTQHLTQDSTSMSERDARKRLHHLLRCSRKRLHHMLRCSRKGVGGMKTFSICSTENGLCLKIDISVYVYLETSRR